MPPVMPSLLRRLARAGQADITPHGPPAVPRRALVLALAAVAATYFLIDRPAADAAARPVAVAAATHADAPQTLTSDDIPYYGFINPLRVVYEE